MDNAKVVEIMRAIRAGTAHVFLNEFAINCAIDKAIAAVKELDAIKFYTPPSDDWEHYADRLYDIAYQSGYEQGKKDAEDEA